MSDSPPQTILPAFTEERNHTEETWRARRRDSIGASEVAAALGLDQFRAPLEVYVAKVTEESPERGGEVAEPMAWGNLLQEPIAREIERREGFRLVDRGRWTTLRSVAYPFLTATLDYEVEPIDDLGPGVLEIKNADRSWQEEWDSGGPLHYLVQVQAQLLVTGWRWGLLGGLVGGNRLAVIRVDRDDAFLRAASRKLGDFWRRVQERRPPHADGSASSARALKRLHPSDSGETINLPAIASVWHRMREAGAAKVAEGKAEIAEAEAELMAELGGSTWGLVPGEEVAYQWKVEPNKGERCAKCSHFVRSPRAPRVLRPVKLKAVGQQKVKKQP